MCLNVACTAAAFGQTQGAVRHRRARAGQLTASRMPCWQRPRRAHFSARWPPAALQEHADEPGGAHSRAHAPAAPAHIVAQLAALAVAAVAVAQPGADAYGEVGVARGGCIVTGSRATDGPGLPGGMLLLLTQHARPEVRESRQVRGGRMPRCCFPLLPGTHPSCPAREGRTGR